VCDIAPGVRERTRFEWQRMRGKLKLMPRKSKLTSFHDLIGTVPDREIASKAGCSIATVCHYRQRYEIPSFRSSLAPDQLEAAPAQVAPTVRPVSRQPGVPVAYGYAVTFAGQAGEVCLIAGSIMEAAERAALHGSITRIVTLGPALGAVTRSP
jgi:hypothetical protein